MNSRSVYPGVITCFFLSGFAALLYQTAWLRQFSFVFGTSELAVAAVLAAYMGGLAVGSAIAARLIHRVRRPVLVYGVLEAGIAVSALAVPLLLAGARWLYASYLGDQPSPPDASGLGQSIFYLVVAFLVLAIPTGFMGATLPLLTRHAVHSNEQLGPRVAMLYATNTFGAVAGAITAGFFLLPVLGLNGTVWSGVVINFLVFVIAVMIAKQASDVDEDSGPAMQTARPITFYSACVSAFWRSGGFGKGLGSVFSNQPGWILPLILISGANAFLYEVLWTRMLSHVLGGSIYAFATMLAAFLTGIALGGGVAGRFAADRNRAAITFGIAQVLIGLLSVGVYAWMGPLIPAERSTGSMAFFAIAVMLPATIFIGATFPLAVRILARNESEAASSTAIVYAWNTVGAIAGAIIAGFWLIPTLGFEGSIRWAVMINLFLALWTFAAIAKFRVLLATSAALLLVLAAWLYHPFRPQAVISRTGFEITYLLSPEELFYAVGRSATVILFEDNGYYLVRSNGLPEASVLQKGGVELQDSQMWLSALPVLARPDARSMMVIGYGGGVVLEGVPPAIEEVDVIEIEPEIIEANRVMSAGRDHDPLADPRMNIIINDARNALRLTSKQYDIIVSQPSHPWTAGASHLFTREFLAESKSHLSDDGVFVQWMNSEFVTESLLRTLAATLRSEFAHVRLYHPTQQVLVFLASDSALDLELQPDAVEETLSADVAHYSKMGLNSVEDLLATLALDNAGIAQFSQGAAISTDNRNLMATDSRPYADGLQMGSLVDLLTPFSPLENSNSWVHTTPGLDINFAYVARRLSYLGQLPRIVGLANAVHDRSDQLTLQGFGLEIQGQGQHAISAWMEAIGHNADNHDARFFIVKKNQRQFLTDQTTIDQEVMAEQLSESGSAVVQGWKYRTGRNWFELSNLDDALANSEVTDGWFIDATKLRAEWRANFAEPEEALELINRAAVLEQDPSLMILRAMNASLVGDAEMFVESARQIVMRAEGTLVATQNSNSAAQLQQLAVMRQNLMAVQRRLGVQVMTDDPQKTNRMQERVTFTLDRINEYLDSVGVTP